jgi:hypothetical protein
VVSDHRRQLHRRIDALREQLGIPSGRAATTEPSFESSLELARHGLIREL